jgi:hypothetical protein
VGAVGLLVPPVRSDAVLRGAVHFAGPDLHFQRFAIRSDHRGMQRLVDPEAGLRDIVLEPARHRLPYRVHDPDCGVAVPYVLDHDSYPDQVVDVIEITTAHDHFLINRVIMLGPTFNGGGDSRAGQLCRDLINHRPQIGIARRRPIGH